MRQYRKIKERHPGALLLFRMGDFYETFGDDAVLVSQILGITLTKRSNGGAADVPLAGFPHHALDKHMPRLVQAGQRVAICEQLEDPKQARKIVKRGVTEVVTPGVSLSDDLLDPRRANYLAAVHFEQTRGVTTVGFAYLDASTGEFALAEGPEDMLGEWLQTINPAEVLVEKKHRERLAPFSAQGFVATPQEDWVFGAEFGYEVLLRHFETHSLKGFGVEGLNAGLVAAGAALHYTSETQKGRLPQVRRLQRFSQSEFMALDPQTRRNLELVASMQHGGQEGTLVGILDHTATPMGARLLRKWLLRPLTDVAKINQRQEAVASLVAARSRRERLREELAQVGDLERLAVKVATGRAQPRDLMHLRLTLCQLPAIKQLLADEPCDTLRKLGDALKLCLDACDRIGGALVDEPPATLAAGGIIREGHHPELDELRGIASGGKDVLARLQQTESERTGITSLKVGFNKVFGYYLEVTHAHKDKVPEAWTRKQTLVNAERYITPELKEWEEKILTAEERLVALEQQLFADLRTAVAEHTATYQLDAQLLAMLDCFAGFAEVAVRYDYARPDVDDGGLLDIAGGRHPVVERTLPPGEPFIPNDARLDPGAEQILVITGPNMAGKSVFLRQCGLIVLLAQVGAFVPAKSARVGVVDRIFTRVGASDNLASGESTFLVEMNETANILNNATPKSLILLDEVGRGTSTFDGLSIAWALVEYLHEHESVAARTLFATHYHELNELAGRFERIRNVRVQVHEHEGKVIFLRKLVAGGADHSYGIEVARMAGLPEPVIRRAREVLRHLEGQPLEVGSADMLVETESSGSASGDGLPRTQPTAHIAAVESDPQFQMSLFSAPDPAWERIREALEPVDPNRLTPIEALLKLSELRRLMDG